MLESTHQSAEVLRRHTGFHLNSFAYTDVLVFRKAQISTQPLSRPHKAETCSQVEHLLRVTNVECSRQPAGLQDTIRSAASAPADAESESGFVLRRLRFGVEPDLLSCRGKSWKDHGLS